MLRSGLLIAFIAIAANAWAQPVFLDGRVAADIRRFSAEPEKSPFDGTAAGFAFGGGSEFIRDWVVALEIDLGGRTTTSNTTSVVFAGQTLTIHNSYSAERRSVSALGGYRTDAHRRWRMGYYAGVSISTLRREIVSDAESVVLGSSAPGSVYDQRLTSVIVGADVAIRVVSHVAIVPALRVQPLTIGTELGGVSVRPSMGVRVFF